MTLPTRTDFNEVGPSLRTNPYSETDLPSISNATTARPYNQR
jgi:hypothetical protein